MFMKTAMDCSTQRKRFRNRTVEQTYVALFESYVIAAVHAWFLGAFAREQRLLLSSVFFVRPSARLE
jgi:hypothetical protein